MAGAERDDLRAEVAQQAGDGGLALAEQGLQLGGGERAEALEVG